LAYVSGGVGAGVGKAVVSVIRWLELRITFVKHRVTGHFFTYRLRELVRLQRKQTTTTTTTTTTSLLLLLLLLASVIFRRLQFGIKHKNNDCNSKHK